MAENPFYVAPANALQALMLGQQGYDRGKKALNEQALSAVRSEAQNALASGGDTRSALARLIGAGDIQGANALANFGNQAATQEYQRGMLGVAQQNANRRDTTLDDQVAQRRRAASGLGLDPSNPAYNSYVLTGKMPREDQAPLTATDKKAILEADESVLQNKAAITALTEAAKISPDANSGYFASTRATIGNNLPDWMVPDAISSPKSSAATVNYDNLVLGQALTSLKSIFGSAPTEGERKILIDLQASADKPDHVRQDILNRARGLAENRLKFNEQRASELRGGTFYKPQGAQPGARPAQTQGAPVRVSSPQERDALPPGTSYVAPDGSIRTKQ